MQATLRKAKRQIHDPARLEGILKQGRILHLAMSRQDQPYLVTLNYGYEAGHIYLHTGLAGLKLEFLAANPRVCFQVISQWALSPGPVACAWNCQYQSVVGFGRVEVLADEEERRQGLLAIVRQCAGPGPHELRDESLARAQVLRLRIEQLTGSARPNPEQEPAG